MAVEEHLNLIDNVQGYTVVVFTCGDHLRNLTIVQHIEREGKPLQWLIRACFWRYHVFNKQEKQNSIQVEKLLTEITGMVVTYNPYCSGPNESTLQREKKRRREERESADNRRKIMLAQRKLKCQIGKS